jgi:hypothetical protein
MTGEGKWKPTLNSRDNISGTRCASRSCTDRLGHYTTAQREPKAGEQQRPISATRVPKAIFCKSAGLSHAAAHWNEDFSDKAVRSGPPLPAQSHRSDSVLLLTLLKSQVASRSKRAPRSTSQSEFREAALPAMLP